MKHSIRNFALAASGIFGSFALIAQPGIYFEPWPLDVTAPNVRLYVDLSSPHCDCEVLSNINADDNPLYFWSWMPNQDRPLLNGMDVNNGWWDESNENLRMWPDADNPNLWYYDFMGASLAQFYGVSEEMVHETHIAFLVKEKNGIGFPEPKSPDLMAYIQDAVPETNIGTVLDFELFSSGSGAAGTNLVWSGVQDDTRLFRLSGTKAVAVADDGSILNLGFIDLGEPSGNDFTLHAFTGMAFSPNFSENGHIFTYAVMANGNGDLFNRISRYTITETDTNQVDMNSEVVLLDFNQDSEANIAGHIEFGPDGYLYISTGDGGLANDPLNRAQGLNNLLGKILRIDVAIVPYAIPLDNPFLGVANTRPEIWIYGLRHPRRFAFDRVSGDLYFTDGEASGTQKTMYVAPGSGAGNNYGWSCYWNVAVNPDFCVANPFFSWPFYTYAPFNWGMPQELRCNITGGRIYRGGEHPEITGRYLFMDQCSGEYWLFMPDGSGFLWTPQLITAPGLTAMSENHAGEIFAVSRDNANIYKMIRPCAGFSASLTLEGEEIQLQNNFTFSQVHWYVNGIPYHVDPGSTDLMPEWDGFYQAVVRNSQGCEVVTNTLAIGPLSSSDSHPESEIRLFPNPAGSHVRVNGNMPIVSFEVYSLDGKRIRAVLTPGITADHVIDVSSLSPGYYLLKVNGVQGYDKVLSFIKE